MRCASVCECTKVAICFMSALCCLMGCQENSNPESGHSEPIMSSSIRQSVQTIEVTTRDLEKTIQLPGSVLGFETAELFAKLGGYVSEVNVDIGDYVQKGQALAQLDVPEMDRAIEQKQALIQYAATQVEQAAAVIKQSESEVLAAQAVLLEVKARRKERQAVRDYRKTEFQRWSDLIASSPVIERRKMDEARFQLEAAEAAIESLEAEIRTALAQVEAAQAQLEKAKADRRAAQSSILVAKSNYEYSRELLNYTTIVAPFDGVVTHRHVHSGSFVLPATNNSAAQPLLSVSRIDKVRIRFDVPMPEVPFLDIGDRVRFGQINALPGVELEGAITRTASSLNMVSRMMRTEVHIKNDTLQKDQRLYPGFYGRVTVYLEDLLGTKTVPVSALVSDGTQRSVFVVEDGMCHKRQVTLNFEDGITAGIDSGLSVGDRVVISGTAQLIDGQEVEVREKSTVEN